MKSTAAYLTSILSLAVILVTVKLTNKKFEGHEATAAETTH